MIPGFWNAIHLWIYDALVGIANIHGLKQSIYEFKSMFIIKEMI